MGSNETRRLSRIERRMQPKAALVESKAMAAADTSTAGKTPLTVENVQDSVVKTLAKQGNASAAFVGMYSF